MNLDAEPFFDRVRVKQARKALGVSHINLPPDARSPLNQAFVFLDELRVGLRKAEITGQQQLVFESDKLKSEGYCQVWIFPNRPGDIRTIAEEILLLWCLVYTPRLHPQIESHLNDFIRKHDI